ncbi:hypothetical protein [Streptomyces sp. NPDC048737]|uniref:hypothetical protein n=1 Tax=unclassified Streptomyces TaxID=2593676 RepID=UPI0034271071
MARPARLPAVAASIALRGVLLLGGLFALGLLLGGQAQAADGVPPAASLSKTVAELASPHAVSGPSSGSVSAPSASVPAPAEETPARPAAPTNPVLPVRERVVKFTGEALEDVSERLAAVVVEGTPTVPPPDLPPLPSLPAPALPVSNLPSLPAPALPALPVSDLPASDLPPAVHPEPVHPEPVHPEPVHPASDPGPDSGTVDPAAPRPSCGPRGVVREYPSGTVARGGVRGRTGHTGTGAHAPAERTPAGAPDGALGSASQLDGGVSRHGDAHAVPPQQRVPLLLVPGSAVRTDVVGIEDRYREIPLFPG